MILLLFLIFNINIIDIIFF